jgi:hypothetical protein
MSDILSMAATQWALSIQPDWRARGVASLHRSSCIRTRFRRAGQGRAGAVAIGRSLRAWRTLAMGVTLQSQVGASGNRRGKGS